MQEGKDGTASKTQVLLAANSKICFGRQSVFGLFHVEGCQIKDLICVFTVYLNLMELVWLTWLLMNKRAPLINNIASHHYF